MITDNPNDPDLHEKQPNGQNVKYLVLSEEEIAKGFVRPFRDAYVHEACGTMTRISETIAKTYAVHPTFYNSTFCVKCGEHFPVSRFHWAGTDLVVGS